MADDRRPDLLIRPSGLVEPLRRSAQAGEDFVPYMTDGERSAAARKHPAERRRRRRAGSERLAGRIVDVEA